MVSKTILMGLLLSMAVMLPTSAFAQDSTDIEFKFSEAEAVIILIGVGGGATSAYLGFRKAKNQVPEVEFDVVKFLDRFIIAVITSVGLAIGAAVDVVQLTLFTGFMIFAASIGTAEVALQARSRKSHSAAKVD